jgi:hypothetical protein
MGLSKERLMEVKRDALAERQKHLEMIQQANGAIAMLDFLLAQCEGEVPENKGNA